MNKTQAIFLGGPRNGTLEVVEYPPSEIRLPIREGGEGGEVVYRRREITDKVSAYILEGLNEYGAFMRLAQLFVKINEAM